MGCSSTARCFFWVGLSSLAFSFMALFIKIGAETLPNSVLIFARSFVMLILVTALCLKKQLPLRSTHWKKLVLRGLAGSGSLALYVITVSRIHLSSAVLLTSLAPIFVVFFSWIFLSEAISRKTLFWVFFSIAGVAFVTSPWHEGQNSELLIGAVTGLSSAACAAAAYTTIRSMSGKVDSEVIVFYFSWIASLLSAPFAFQDWTGLYLPTTSYIVLILIGLLGFLGQLFMTYGYKFGSATLASSFGLLSIVLSTAWSIVFLDDDLTWSNTLGTIIILLGVWQVSQNPVGLRSTQQK